MSDFGADFVKTYFSDLRALLSVDANLGDGLERTRELWLKARDTGGKVIFVGNGGSAGIAAHLAIDAGKNAGIPALNFGDSATITCLANDYGFEHWLAHALRLHAKPQDCLVAISSSGRSPNVLNGVAKAREIGMSVVTLSGMAPDNPLRAAGDVNLWLDSRAYNHIETVHQAWMMCVIDMIIGRAVYPAS
jgi:phosphoheptose isomerase